ncbi:MAG: InlB B-repeat-containing protein [Bacilli bacterium]|nr:InlB B-repeat-containing protein [Bacilli bacterium]
MKRKTRKYPIVFALSFVSITFFIASCSIGPHSASSDSVPTSSVSSSTTQEQESTQQETSSSREMSSSQEELSSSEEELSSASEEELSSVSEETFSISEETSSTSQEPEQIIPKDNDVTFERVIMKTKEQIAVGSEGAGCQWPVSLESSKDGSLMLYGIDVAGLYKSVDHGETWSLACSGMKTRGVGMFAIDPFNTNHVVALGLGKIAGSMHVSYDGASSWKQTDFRFKSSGARYLWDGLEFDPTSYDQTENRAKCVYFTSPYDRDTAIRTSPTTKPSSSSSLSESEVGLYLSTDGGETFSLAINDKKLADGIVKITEDGDVYVGSQYGLFLIDKEKNEIKKTYFSNDPDKDYSKGITGLDVVGNTVFAQTWDGIFAIEGDDVGKITNDDYPNKWPQFLEVSQSNPDHMVYQVRRDVNNYYVNDTVVSFDGGHSWTTATNERNSLLFQSSWEAREKLYIIDPSDDDNVITFGNDCLVQSLDGGKTFKQTKGISNMMQGGRFNFNYFDPDLLLFSAQDYTGVISMDGGVTYRALSIPNKGNFYGGFAADEDTIWGFANEKWNGGTLTYTHDGGATWTDTGLSVSGVPGAAYYSSLQSPTNPNVLFAAEYYSTDKGYTWNKMEGCVSVFTFNYEGKKELYGANEDGDIVVSYDNGASWQILSNENWRGSDRLKKQTILDLAYDHENNVAYALVQSLVADYQDESKIYTIEEVYKYDIANKTSKKMDIPVDGSGTMRQKSVAVDPNAPSIVYVGGAGEYFSSDTALLRSIDGGETWCVLTTQNNSKYKQKSTNQGGYEVSTIRVNPYDGSVWIACGCYGYETFNPPYDASLIQREKPQSHTVKYYYQNRLVNEVVIKNNGKHNYVYDEDGLTFVNWYRDKELTIPFPNGSNVYETLSLYAKMEPSVRIGFYDGTQLLKEVDLDQYNPADETQIPVKEGYVFAGWYTDLTLTEKVDFSTITQDSKVYAGWYKVLSKVELNNKDIGGYIKYSDKTLQKVVGVEDNENVDNRCAHFTVEGNSTYFVTMKMNTRFRMGMKKSVTSGTLSPVYIDERDDNGRIPVDEYVSKTIEAGDATHLFIYYYTSNGTRNFMDIRNTLSVYKIESGELV